MSTIKATGPGSNAASVGGPLIRPHLNNKDQVRGYRPDADAVVLRKPQRDNNSAEVSQYGPLRRNSTSGQTGQTVAATVINASEGPGRKIPGHDGGSDDKVQPVAVTAAGDSTPPIKDPKPTATVRQD